MENFNGYLVMKQYSSGSKSDGFVPYLYISPYKVYKLYWALELGIIDTFFNEYNLKYVSIQGVLHHRIRSINVESINLSQDPFLNNSDETGLIITEEE